jgi:hypothetical protein
MILDAGCGNRCMWQEKVIDSITYMDVQKRLERKPTLFADNCQMPLKSEIADTVFFDPPFGWGWSTHPFFSFPNRQEMWEKYPDIRKDANPPGYYGIERFTHRSQLVSYIYRSEKELYRVLKNDGCLWLRWANMGSMNETQVLGIFQNWKLCLTHEIHSSHQTNALRVKQDDNVSFWFMLMKKPLTYKQNELEVS